MALRDALQGLLQAAQREIRWRGPLYFFLERVVATLGMVPLPGAYVESWNSRTGVVTLLPSDFDDTIHGARGGNTLHALAIAGGDAGFISGADQAKLDGLPSTVARELSWRANGDLSLFTVDATPPAGDGGDAFFDGATLIISPLRISLLSMTQRATGSAGVTTAEVWRVRGGVYFLLGTLANPVGLPLDVATTVPPAAPDDDLLFGDLVLVRFTAVQTADATDVPQDAVVQIHGVSL